MNPQCGSAPYANWKKGRSRDILFASATPQTTIYASLCPAPLVVTDGSGMSGPIDVAANTPFWFLGTAAGYHPSATVEMKWPLGSSSSQLDLDMFPVSKAPVSDWYAGSSPSEATIWVALTAAPTATCTVAGWTLAVEGHPEAKVSYFGATGKPDPSLTATVDSSGKGNTFVVLSGITPGEPANVVGTKAGCGPLAAPAPVGVAIATGRHPLLADTHVYSTLVTP